MATYRLLDGQSGRPGVGSSGTQPPSSPTTYNGNYIAGLVFQVTEGGKYFNGYWWYVPAGGDTNGNVGFALWQTWGSNQATVIPASEILWGGSFTAGAWNFVPCNPIPLTPGIPYVAQIGFSTTIGFPDTQNQFGSGEPYVGGITNGPLTAYSGTAGNGDFFWPQSPYSTAGADASVTLANSNDQNDLLWLDVQVTDQVPSGTPLRAWPAMPTALASATNTGAYTLSMQFSLTAAGQLSSIWHYSPSGAVSLPSRCGIWDVATQTVIPGTDNQSPVWLKPDGSTASAGAGWIQCDYRSLNITLATGKQYKVATFGTGGDAWWSYLNNAFGAGQLWGSGFTHGILTIPGSSAASPAQGSFNATTWAYPSNAAGNNAAFCIDVGVLPVPASHYRFMDGQNGRPGNGPTSAISYSGNFISGLSFMPTQGNTWFEGYWHWVAPTNGLTAPQKFALWTVNPMNASQSTVVPGSAVTSGTLSTGWNYVPLTSPIPLAVATQYIAATGINGNFPESDTNGDGTGTVDSFGAGGHVNGILNGPIFAFSDTGSSQGHASHNGGLNMGNGVFTTSGSDPTTTCPEGVFASSNFWLDIQVTTTAPTGYSGSYRSWPNKFYQDSFTSGDSSVNYVVGTEMHLSESCALNKIWYYSPGGTSQLATRCDVWNVDTQVLVASNTSPTWSGGAASGWISCGFTGITLPAGRYRVSIYNGAATPDAWSAKQLYYWNIGAGYQYQGSTIQCSGPTFDGIWSGPLYTPNIYNASSTTVYTGGGANGSFDQGSTTQGQAVFAVGPPNKFPDTYVKGLGQTYWVDMEITPGGGSSVTSNTSSVLIALFP